MIGGSKMVKTRGGWGSLYGDHSSFPAHGVMVHTAKTTVSTCTARHLRETQRIDWPLMGNAWSQ